MAGYIGKIEAFDETQESWESYTERLEQYFKVNKVDDELKVAALLSLIGGKTYTLLRNLATPEKPADKTYDEIVKLLKDHLSPEPLQIAERHRFIKRVQLEGENINTYVAALRKLSEHCGYPDLENTLRDQLVVGLRNEQIKKRLLSEAKLTLVKAIETAQAMETAAKDALELKNRETVGVNILRRGPPNKPPRHSEHKQQTKCYRCNGFNHRANECRFKEATCYKCSNKGHIERACRSKAKQKPRPSYQKPVHSLDEDTRDAEQDLSNLGIFSVRGNNNNPIWIEPEIDGKFVRMELDTGSALSVMSKRDFEDMFGNKPLEKTSVTLKTYSGEMLKPLGYINAEVKYRDQNANLKVYVLNTGCHPLFGREWLQSIQINWKSLKSLYKMKMCESNPPKSLEQMLKTYENVFSEGLGKVKGIKAKFTFKPDSAPKFCKARPVPYALKPKIEQELRRLQDGGIIVPVDNSEWATPIVPVLKKDGNNVRICGDFKVTVNPQLAVDQYPLPRIEDIFASLSGGKKFSKIDLKHAYLQLEVDEKHQEYLTINTTMGLFRYTRICFGTASAPAIWQRTIDQILSGLSGVQCILDDMIVTGENDAQHLENLEKVLKRLSEYNMKVNLDKCEFFKEKVQYCGHEIDVFGLHKVSAKIESVLNTPTLQNVTELRAFLGLLNYYHRFLENISTVMKPMTKLLEKGQKWIWDKSCESAFQKAKEMVTSDLVLCHHDPKCPIRLACDASPFRVGAVISHIMNDGTKRPIAFASRTLTKTEQNRSQIDKEATAIIFGVKKFHTYLFGRHFTLITDNQPLVSIFSPKKGISMMTAARLQRYALYLTGYDYDIEYRNTKRHTNADSLS